MKSYPDELKFKIITRLLSPNNEYVHDVSRETGIPKDTLYAWQIKHRRGAQTVKADQSRIAKLTSAQKFDIVLETAGMNEAELSEYCRRSGFYPEQIDAWKQACRFANYPDTGGYEKKDCEAYCQLM